MASLTAFVPFQMVAPNQLNKILFCFDMGDADKIIDIPIADLTSIFHTLSYPW
jgi:hypothetical protein